MKMKIIIIIMLIFVFFSHPFIGGLFWYLIDATISSIKKRREKKEAARVASALAAKQAEMLAKQRAARKASIEEAIAKQLPGYKKHLKPGSRYLTKGY